MSRLLAHRDGRRFDGPPSLLGHCGHEAIFGAHRSVANDPMYGPAVRRKRISSICRHSGLASMYPASDWSGCSGPSWMSARMRSHYRPGLERAIWVTRVCMRRKDRSSISSYPLADLGRKTGLCHRFLLIRSSSFVRAVSRSFIPACSACRAPRAGAVKAGRSCGHPQGLALTAPSTVPGSGRSG